MTITEIVEIAKTIHDAEGWHLGLESTREERNQFWERVIGCVYWGHPIYNVTPDTHWLLKDPDGPQGSHPTSDDVTVYMPGRIAFDCIIGAGGADYKFQASEPFVLPEDQYIFVPSTPVFSIDEKPPVPSHPKPPYPGDAIFANFGLLLEEDYKKVYSDGLDGLSAIWVGRVIWDHLNEHLTIEDSIAKHRTEWLIALGLL